MVDDDGRVVGVVVSKVSVEQAMAETGTVLENVGFAIKSTELRRLLHDVSLPRAGAAGGRDAAIRRAESAVCQVVTRS